MSDGWVTCLNCGRPWHRMAGGPCDCQARIERAKAEQDGSNRALLLRALDLLEQIAKNTEPKP